MTLDMLGIGYGNESALFGVSATIEGRRDCPLGDKPRLSALPALDNSITPCFTSLHNRRPGGGNLGAESPDRTSAVAQNSAVLPSVSAFLEESSGNSQGSASLNHSPRTKTCLYKTEVCCSWKKHGRCRYGSKCQFAHGADELRPVQRHPKYKTEICRSFAQTGECRYGRRCRFIHPEGLTGSAAEYATLGTPNSLMTHGSGSLSASSDPFPRSVQSSVHLGQNPSLLSYSDPAPHAMHSASSCSGSLPVDSVQQLHQKLSAYLPLSTPSAADSLGAQYQLLPPQDPSGSLIGAASHQEHHAAGVTMQGGHALDLFNHTFSPSLNMYTAGPGMTHAYTHMLPPLADSSAFSLPGSSLDAPLAQLSPDTLQLSPEMSQLSPELLHLLLASSTGLPGSPAYSTVPQFVEQSSQWLNHLDQVGLSQQLQGLGSNPHAVMDQLAAPGCGPSLISHQVSNGPSLGWDGIGYTSWAPSC